MNNDLAADPRQIERVNVHRSKRNWTPKIIIFTRRCSRYGAQGRSVFPFQTGENESRGSTFTPAQRKETKQKEKREKKIRRAKGE